MISAAFKDRATAGMWVALFASVASHPFEVRRNVYRQYITSEAWARRRAAEIQKACGMCSECGLTATFGNPLQVHHVSYKHLGNELPSELVVLCRLCHGCRHGKADVVRAVDAVFGPEDEEREREREENKWRRGHYTR